MRFCQKRFFFSYIFSKEIIKALVEILQKEQFGSCLITIFVRNILVGSILCRSLDFKLIKIVLFTNAKC